MSSDAPSAGPGATGKLNGKVSLKLGGLPPKPDVNAMKKTASAYPRTPSRTNPNNPPWPAFRGYHEFSFAHAVMSHRLPTILGKGIDDVHMTLNQESDEDRVKDLVECIHRMEDLLDDMKGNAKLRPIIDDGAGDIPLWNKEIAKYFQGKDFMNAPWLFAEAYKYRRLRECFTLSKYWSQYDIFFRQKCDTFARSSDAVFELAARFCQPYIAKIEETGAQSDVAIKKMFRELLQVCLWGNSTDLSLLIDMTEDDIKALQATDAAGIAASEAKILSNDLDKITEYTGSLKGARVDFVMDNAGLFTDLIIADFLIASGICREVRFHGKIMPWFVSDVTRKDFDWIINNCCYSRLFPDASEEEMASLRILGHRWKQFEKEGKFVYEQHPFWCSGFTFHDLPTEAPDLFLHLSKSDLAIFKGDLNHRKLTYDCQAPYTTTFSEAIGPMSTTPGAPPVVSLRTIKSDVIVGLQEGVGEKLDEEEKGWHISGKYAVVQWSDGRPGEKVVFN